MRLLADLLRRLLVAALFFSVFAQAQAGNGSRAILVFGDSLSTAYGFDSDQSWVSLLSKRLEELSPGYRVVNASISGETTRGGATRIDSVIAAHEPEIVLVELGGNDGLRGIDLEATRRNLERIIDASLNAGAHVLLFAMELPPNYGPGYIQEFRDIYQILGKREGVILVPFFLEGVAENPTLMQSDGIHPEAEAQPILLENVWPYLRPLVKG